MTLHERLNDNEKNSIDRRKISNRSCRELAETYHHGNLEAFAAKTFHILLGQSVEECEPWRNVEGTVSLSDSVEKELGGKRITVEVSGGSQTSRKRLLPDTEGTEYRFSELPDGTYPVDATVTSVSEYDAETMETTTYEVVDYTVEIVSESVEVDTETVGIGQEITGPDVTVTDIEIGDELTESDTE